jgi:hypothetical protein
MMEMVKDSRVNARPVVDRHEGSPAGLPNDRDALIIPEIVQFRATGQVLREGDVKKSEAVVVESYYRAKWGLAGEFIGLYKKNHLPVLRQLQQEGRIQSIVAVKPRYHTTEEGRWDYRVTLTFRDATVAHDPGHEDAIKKQLFPDQITYVTEEQRRFEILSAHWDILVDDVDLDEKS